MTVALEASVVMPTHGRRESVIRTLRALGRQSLASDSFEVVLVCDGDVDGTVAACRELSNSLPFQLWVLEQENSGPASARNLGVREARAPLIVFLDDDVVPDEDVLARHLEAHRASDRLVTIGPLLPPLDARLSLWAQWEERTLCRQYADMQVGKWEPTYRQFYTGNAAVRRQAILEAGGFDPELKRAEDVELALRLAESGFDFAFLPEARAWHYITRSFTSWLRIPGAYGEADVHMAQGDRSWILARIQREFGRRHPLVRRLVQFCKRRPATYRATVQLLAQLIRVFDALQLPYGYAFCSLLFNLCYYEGVSRATQMEVASAGERHELTMPPVRARRR